MFIQVSPLPVETSADLTKVFREALSKLPPLVKRRFSQGRIDLDEQVFRGDGVVMVVEKTGVVNIKKDEKNS